MAQNPKIALDESTKLQLTSLKQNDNQSYNDVIKGLIAHPNQNQLFSIANQGTIPSVGATNGQESFNSFSRTLRWISDTQNKLVGEMNEWSVSANLGITPSQRELAFQIDPLLRGIISQYLKNTILGDFNLISDDNKKFSNCITDVKKFIKDIRYMETARDDFENLAIKHGKTYWRKDRAGNKVKRLQILDAKSMMTHVDNWDSSIKLHHQRIKVSNVFSSSTSTSTTEYNSWFIPDGLIIIEEDEIGNDVAWAKWAVIKEKYGISETTGLRVGASEDIIDMHRGKIGDPAPIDAAILAIWLKRMVIANAPNLILNAIVPFMHMKHGMMAESINPETGLKQIITSVPQQPPAGMATTNPELYTALNSAYTNFQTSMADNVKNVMRYRAENGLLATGPDVTLTPIQSATTIASSFISTIIDVMDREIGQSVSFPVDLISAAGAELATSRSVGEQFRTGIAGMKQDYERVAMELIEEQFAGQSWDYEIEDKYGETQTGTFTFEETGLEFLLGEQDKTDSLKEAQTELITLQSAQLLKALGASLPDIQSFLDEKDMGIYDLDNFDQAQQQQQDGWGNPGTGQGGDAGNVPRIPGGMPAGLLPALPNELKKPTPAEMMQSTTLMSYNENHDDAGRFAAGDGGGSSGGSDVVAKLKEGNWKEKESIKAYQEQLKGTDKSTIVSEGTNLQTKSNNDIHSTMAMWYEGGDSANDLDVMVTDSFDMDMASSRVKDRAFPNNAKTAEVNKEIIQKTYVNTQEFLKDGPDTITVYRGVDGNTKNKFSDANIGDMVEAETYNISSWSTDPKIAETFARGQYNGIILEAKIPKEQVFLHYDNSARGIKAEKEIVVLGNKVPAKITTVFHDMSRDAILPPDSEEVGIHGKYQSVKRTSGKVGGFDAPKEPETYKKW